MNRCLYNALNDRIRNLLLKYDYSKSTDPLQPYAAHVSSLLTRDHPKTWDIAVTDGEEVFFLHKFIISARSPYFQQKLAAAPDSKSWKLPNTIPPQAFSAAIKYLYLGEAPRELRSGPGTGFTESQVVAGIDKIAKHLQIPKLLDSILDSGDRRLTRQRRTAEVERGRDQIEEWFLNHVLGHKVVVDTSRANEVKWDRNNAIFADVLLRADESIEDGEYEPIIAETNGHSSSIPIGLGASGRDAKDDSSDLPSRKTPPQKSVLYPVHRAMLIRSEFFNAMFSSSFKEAYMEEHLHIVSIDCSPEVLETILTFFYTEKAEFPLRTAVEVLFAADRLLIERLKTKAAVVISSLGSGTFARNQASSKAKGGPSTEDGEIDIYEIIRAGWLTRVQRLEEFGARYLAWHLEDHIDNHEFAELIAESAGRIQKREETDSIELLDDIRFYLSERFRMRFDDTGLSEMIVSNAPNTVNEPAGNGLVERREKPTDPTATNDQSAAIQPDGQQESVIHEQGPIIRTIDGEIVEDEFDQDAMNYSILMEKLEGLLEKLELDA